MEFLFYLSGLPSPKNWAQEAWWEAPTPTTCPPTPAPPLPRGVLCHTVPSSTPVGLISTHPRMRTVSFQATRKINYLLEKFVHQKFVSILFVYKNVVAKSWQIKPSLDSKYAFLIDYLRSKFDLIQKINPNGRILINRKHKKKPNLKK